MAQTLTIGGPAEGEVEVELEVVVAEEGKDVAISLRLHDMAPVVLTLRSIGLNETWYRIGSPTGAWTAGLLHCIY